MRQSIATMFAAVLLLASVAPAVAAPTVRRPRGSLAVGEPPPPLALDRIAGQDAVTLQGLTGRVVVLDFWATWCGPCRAVMPSLDAMYRRHRANGLSVVGLSSESDAAIRAHIAAAPVDYTIARDIGGTQRAYGVRAIPTLVVLDRTGKVREVMIGVDGPSLQRLDGIVQQLLTEPAP